MTKTHDHPMTLAFSREGIETQTMVSQLLGRENSDQVRTECLGVFSGQNVDEGELSIEFVPLARFQYADYLSSKFWRFGV